MNKNNRFIVAKHAGELERSNLQYAKESLYPVRSGQLKIYFRCKWVFSKREKKKISELFYYNLSLITGQALTFNIHYSITVISDLACISTGVGFVLNPSLKFLNLLANSTSTCSFYLSFILSYIISFLWKPIPIQCMICNYIFFFLYFFISLMFDLTYIYLTYTYTLRF